MATKTKKQDVLQDESIPLLDRLYAQREVTRGQIEPLIEAREVARSEFEARTVADDEDERPSDEERQAHLDAEVSFQNESKRLLDNIDELDKRIREQEVIRRSREIAERVSTGEVRVASEPLTYRQDNQRENSYFMDLAAAMVPEVRGLTFGSIDGFQDRLNRHAAEMADVVQKRSAERARRAERAVDEAEREARSRYGIRGGLEESPFMRNAAGWTPSDGLESRAPSRIVGQGGYAIPPLWLVDQYIPALRPGRVAAGLARNVPLPPGTDSINIPRLQTPTLTAIQTGDAAPVASRDFTDTFQQAESHWPLAA